ncbi:MAG: hypothetical protein HRU31_17765, partial [Rhodobacteraceae bacterium]|nr:hypothetical protein [Paracoccaceae bacterium]
MTQTRSGPEGTLALVVSLGGVMPHLLYALLASIMTATLAAAETLEERGAYLVMGPGACGNCHTPLGPEGPVPDQRLAGRLVEQNEMFTAIAPNITPASRIAGWSDEELGRAIREGLRPDGSLIGPPMPYAMYRGLSDRDVQAIVAFLRTVPAGENDPGVSRPTPCLCHPP